VDGSKVRRARYPCRIAVWGLAHPSEFLNGIAGAIADFTVSHVAQCCCRNLAGWAFVWGLTFTGYFLVLWPLAYLNHSVVARAWSEAGTEMARPV